MTETHSKVRLKILLWDLKLPCTFPNEWFERNDFLSNLSNSNFLQTLSGKYPAVLWKPNSTRPDEPMKSEVLIRSSLIPKKTSEFEENDSGLGWNISAWLEILHSRRSKKELNRKFFATVFVSQWLPGYEWNLVQFLADFFQGFVNGAIYVSRRTFRGRRIFLKNSKQTFFSELGQKTLSLLYQKVPWTTIENGLFSCRLTLSMKWFFRENFRFLCFNWILSGKTPAELSKKCLRWQKNYWWKWFFTSNDLTLDNVMSHRTNFFGFWLKVLKRDVNTAFSASRWWTSGKTSFSGRYHQFQFLLGFWGRRIWTFTKKYQDLQVCN